MTLADLKSPMLLTLLGVFAAGWIALYWIMADRVADAQHTAIALHGQQETKIQAHNETFTKISRTLGTLEERSEHQAKMLEEIKTALKTINASIQTMNGTLTELKADIGALKDASHFHNP